MSLYTSLFSGVSGLKNHQVMLDVIGNNITNVNTIGFKASRTTFSELFSQTRISAFRPSGEAGGINPQQIGLGANVASIDAQFTQGNLEASGISTDLGITGGGFFVVNAEGRQMFTRVGNFSFDGSGNMVLPSNGAILQGKLAKEDGTIPAETQISNLKLSLDRKAPAKATTLIKLSGNLDNNAPIATIIPPATTPPAGSTVPTTFSVYDSLGNQHSITVTFSKTAANNWNWSAALSNAPTTPIGSGTVTFNDSGTLTGFTPPVSTTGGQISFMPTNGSAQMNLNVFDNTMLNKFSGVTQTHGTSLVNMRDQDGYASGTLENIAVEKNGRIQGKFSNGVIISLGQILLAEFNNPGGLSRNGESMYSASGNSGTPAYIIPGEGSTSEISGGALETSNVDLAEEFTRMIIAQRGYQSNARIITTTDEILQETVNLKR
jgi:flagellar hook protein FlgE